MIAPPNTAAQKLEMMGDRAHTCEQGQRQNTVGTDQDMSLAHCANGPKILNKALNASDKLKYIDSNSVSYYLKSKKVTLEKLFSLQFAECFCRKDFTLKMPNWQLQVHTVLSFWEK